MLRIFFKRFYTNSIYNFMPRLLLFALFFLNSSLPSILYSQLGKQCICTHKMHFQLVGTISQSPETVKLNFHGATPIGFVILMYFQHFINFSLLPFPIYEFIFSDFLCRFGISKMLEKFCFYQFFQHPGQDRKRISLYLMAISW